ncbi:hypothetical protein Glove_108g63 [Diversispora epigaea]|uniref:RING-type domain-containing protein n=1 Tax=Diversispora epigaea TaxID=1348612 RepID=A0A397J7A1_9GLOM|nr:hypothetical protein Glove_108g63 [Diversispora epigaea]
MKRKILKKKGAFPYSYRYPVGMTRITRASYGQYERPSTRNYRFTTVDRIAPTHLHRNESIKILALNILKHSSEIRFNNIVIPEQKPCIRCKGKILSTPSTPITILTCGHVVHRTCIEEFVANKPEPRCPDCGNFFTDSSNNYDNIIEFFEVKDNENSGDESRPHNFLHFFSIITHAESKDDTMNQEVIRSYLDFGKTLKDRRKELIIVACLMLYLIENFVSKFLKNITKETLRKRAEKPRKSISFLTLSMTVAAPHTASVSTLSSLILYQYRISS